ncbi:MAG: VanZ family protein [Lachnospiraceae bacterium]
MKHILRPLSFLPALLVMYLIFSLSGQQGDVSSNLSYNISYKAVELGSQILKKEFNEEQLSTYADKIHYYVRKTGHMAEYFILALCVSFPLYVYGLRGLPLLFIAGIICVSFAALDEFHQSFVAGRTAAVKDVLIDSVGIFLGITVVRIFCYSILTVFSGGKHKQAKKKRSRR